MSTGLHLRDLNDLVTRRAQRMLAKAVEDAADAGHRLTVSTVATRMSQQSDQSAATIRKHLSRLLDGGASWRADDMQRFANALGRPVEDLLTDDVDVVEATAAGQLYRTLNERMSASDMKNLLQLIHLGLDDQPVYELSAQISLLLHDSLTRPEAIESVLAAVQSSAMWAENGSRAYVGGAKRRPKRKQFPSAS